ncbi:MAG: aldose 1-epimerase family protein [Lachnospiraceae bacterium]|nr:aldose 1-epimerase family protein [Lachnospiraceae bacterium]
MDKYTIKNDELTVSVNSFGAEISSIKDNKTNHEYIWCGDATFWNRQSPVLFPIVGILKNKEMRYKGKVYTMGQHGFARDNEFELEKISDQEVWFVFQSSEKTLEMYPFEFILHIGYKLNGRKLEVLWKIENPSDEKIYFSIGGHPAFYYPESDSYEYMIEMDSDKDLTYGEIDVNSGCIVKGIEHTLSLNEGRFTVDENTFNNDALVFENSNVSKVSILHSDKTPYITVEFDMPLFALWSPANKKAPFMCIEPWCGRCDYTTFDGNFEDKEYINKLNSKDEFNQKYSIIFN